MHQRVDERQLGNLVFSSLAGDIPVSYDASFEQENEWNFLLGGSAGLSKQWNASIEGGFGDRKQVMGNLTFRF